MEKPVSRRAFVAAAGSAAAAAAGFAAWKASRPNPVPAAAPVETDAAIPARTALIDVDGWLLTPDDVDSLPDRTTWVVETQ